MKRTHCDRLLVVLLAAHQVRDFGANLRGKGTPVHFDPLLHLVVRAALAKVPGDGDCETFEWVLHVGKV